MESIHTMNSRKFQYNRENIGKLSVFFGDCVVERTLSKEDSD